MGWLTPRTSISTDRNGLETPGLQFWQAITRIWASINDIVPTTTNSVPRTLGLCLIAGDSPDATARIARLLPLATNIDVSELSDYKISELGLSVRGRDRKYLELAFPKKGEKLPDSPSPDEKCRHTIT